MAPQYPVTRTDDAIDSLAGLSFDDPFRWLEQGTEEVQSWQRAQSELAAAHVREWPQFERLKSLVCRFNLDRPERGAGLPRFANGKWFYARTIDGSSHSQVIASDRPFGQGRVLFDADSSHERRHSFLSWIAPSPDGRVLALGLCTDGSENNTIRLIDAATAEELPQPPQHTLMDNWTGGVQWLPDSTGFFFSAISGAATDFDQQVYLHRRDSAPITVALSIPWTTAKQYRAVIVSRDGRHAVALERLTNTIPVAVARLDRQLRWEPFITAVNGTVAGHIIAERYIAVTDVGAARGRLVEIPLGAQNPSDPRTWRELISESDAVMRTVTPVGDVLYLSELVDTYSRVRIVDLAGQCLGEVPLPGRGAIGELSFPISTLAAKLNAERFVFSYSSFTASSGIYSHAPGNALLETLQEPEVTLSSVVTEDHWSTSSDGTRIPYHVVRRTDVLPTTPQPTLLYAYGGFNAPLNPQFPGPMAAFITAGGVLVHAHVRGGGEFGLEWWNGGRLRQKQNCYHDLYSVAEDLIASRRCTPNTLAMMGGSNGGLMAGVAATQRPELWKVLVARVPVLDLIGACRDPYQLMVCINAEYANVDDPEEVRRLVTFSPYHLVRNGTRYPAMFLDAGATDPRCPPWHARKFAARMQRANRSDTPILLHVWDNVGHGWATDKSSSNTQHTEWLAFTLRHLGVSDWV